MSCDLSLSFFLSLSLSGMDTQLLLFANWSVQSPSNINVTVLCPGYISSELTAAISHRVPMRVPMSRAINSMKRALAKGEVSSTTANSYSVAADGTHARARTYTHRVERRER